MAKIIQEVTVFETETIFNVLPRVNVSVTVGESEPAVTNIQVLVCQNAGAIVVTDFLNGADGQTIRVIGDGFTTVADNSHIKTSTGVNKLLSQLVYRFTHFGGTWFEDA